MGTFNKEWGKLYRLKNKDKLNEKTRAWRLKHKDEINSKRKLTRDTTKENEQRKIRNKAIKERRLIDPEFNEECRLKYSLKYNERKLSDPNFLKKKCEWGLKKYHEKLKFDDNFKEKMRLHKQKWIKELSDNYVNQIMNSKKTNIQYPKELIDLNRQLILLKREMRNSPK